MTRRSLAIVCFLSLAAAGQARAGGWTYTVGAQIGVGPPYEGANRDILEPAPTFDLRPKGSPERFTPPDGGTTLALFSNKYIEIGPMARFRYERPGTGELKGFSTIHWAAEPGAYLDLWPTSWLRARVEARKGVTGHIGWIGDAGLDLVYNGKRWDASVGPRIGWGDHRYMSTYFGVTPAEAARNPVIHEVYDPDAGQRYTGVETAVGYHLGRRWRLIADIGYQRLSGPVARSPIVHDTGSADQYSSSLGFTYSFNLGR